ncbi:MAG: NADPH-dependent F420 reductase [Saccharofermentanales bacterium]|jgi:NADPH-dependent F420 reductase
MKIAFIGGTGNLGLGLALRCANAGFEILIGSRNAEKAKETEREILAKLPQASVTGSSNEVVAGLADLIVIALPYAALIDTLPHIATQCSGKLVLDTTVPMKYGRPPVYQAPAAGSAGQEVALMLPESQVVSGLHTMSAASLSNLDYVLDSDALICGDDKDAKQTVIDVFSKFIPRIFDAGKLSNANAIERLTPLVISINQIYKRGHVGIKLTNI